MLWRYGKEHQWAAEGLGRPNFHTLLTKSKTNPQSWKLVDEFGGREITHIKGIAIFFDKPGTNVPTIYEQFLRKFEARAEVEVLLHFRALQIPHVDESERFTVARTSLPNCYRVVVRHGYNDAVVNENLGDLVYEKLRNHLVRPATAAQDGVLEGVDAEKVEEDGGKTAKRLERLDNAYSSQTVYIVGKEELRLLKSNNIVKRFVLHLFLWLRENSRTKVSSMQIPIDKLVEVGFVKDM